MPADATSWVAADEGLHLRRQAQHPGDRDRVVVADLPAPVDGGDDRLLNVRHRRQRLTGGPVHKSPADHYIGDKARRFLPEHDVGLSLGERRDCSREIGGRQLPLATARPAAGGVLAPNFGVRVIDRADPYRASSCPVAGPP